RVVKVFFSGAFDAVVGLASSGGGRERDPELVGKVEREAEILVHEAQGKTRNVLAFEEIGSFDVEYAGAGHTGLHNFDEFFALNPSARDESQSFRERVDLQGEDQIHCQLDGLSGAMRAQMKQFFAHDAEDGLGLFQGFGITTDHEDEFSFLGTPVAAGDGRIKKPDAALTASGRDSSGKRGRNGARVDVDAAGL